MSDPTRKGEEPEQPDKTRRRQDDEADVERQQPVRREPADADADADVEEVPARRGGGDSGDIERGAGAGAGAAPPGREGHEREMQERRPHRDEPA